MTPTIKEAWGQGHEKGSKAGGGVVQLTESVGVAQWEFGGGRL